MIEHELARSVLLERFLTVNSPEWRFRKEWQALRACVARSREIEQGELRLERLRERQQLARAA